MKKIFLLSLVLFSASASQALNLQDTNHISCATDGRGTFNLTDLQSDNPAFVSARAHALSIKRLNKSSITYVHPNGDMETLMFDGHTYYSSGQITGYRALLSNTRGLSQSVRCSVF